MKTLTIRPMIAADFPAVARIYEEGLATRLATFETEVPNWAHWHAKYLPTCRLVAAQEEEVLGWAALSAVSSRPVYQGVAELSIYMDAKHRGKGIGSTLMGALITASEAAGIWTLQSSLFPENKASVQLHERFGFRKIGYRERIAQLDGQWRNTWLYERRSSVID